MKKLFFIPMIAVFLLLCANRTQGQDPQAKLNQIELMKQMVGAWQNDMGKDSIGLSEVQQYGNAFTEYVYHVVKGKKSLVNIWNMGFSPKDDKFMVFQLRPDGAYRTWIGAFVSEKKCVMNRVQNFNPEKVFGKVEMVIEPPTNLTGTWFNAEGKKSFEEKWHKIK